MLRCRTCRTIVHPKALACSKCGYAPLLGHKYCQECGANTVEGQAACTSCKAVLPNADVKKSVSEAGGQEMKKRYCRNCAHEVHAEAAACVKCGFPPQSMDKYCQTCAAETKPGQMLCVSCGNRLLADGVSALRPSEANQSSARSKSKVAAGLLAIFLGQIGIHKFYLGYTTPALFLLMGSVVLLILSLVLSAMTLGIGFLLFLPICFLTWVVAAIEGIMYFTKSDEEFDALYVQGRREWF